MKTVISFKICTQSNVYTIYFDEATHVTPVLKISDFQFKYESHNKNLLQNT